MDLYGGLPPELEYFQHKRPDDPRVRDSATLWVMDQGGALALPRVTLDAIGSAWHQPNLQLNLVLADGRSANLWASASGTVHADAQGRAIARDAGSLRFRCHEPFQHWSLSFDGAINLSALNHSTTTATTETSKPASLSFHLDAHMCVPPWLMGGLSEEASEAMRAGGAAALMGGVRYEQLCRIRGWLRLDQRDYPLLRHRHARATSGHSADEHSTRTLPALRSLSFRQGLRCHRDGSGARRATCFQ